MSKEKLFKDIEKKLNKKFINLKENEVILREDDFEDGKLTKSGYISLKQQSDYISVHEDIEIRIPKSYLPNFKEQLEYMATKELIRIRKDIRDSNWSAAIFFLTGLFLLSLQGFTEFFNIKIINDIIIIISWVFIWASIEKRFFDLPKLKGRRINILHILSSNVYPYKREEEIIEPVSESEFHE